jgi:hypothetical protein
MAATPSEDGITASSSRVKEDRSSERGSSARQQTGDEQDEEHDKTDLGEKRRRAGDQAKAQESCDQRDNQKYNAVV